MVIDCLQQLFEGNPLSEKTLTDLERWAEQYPYHLSPNLIRLWNERLGGPVECDEDKLNRIAFFMADRVQLYTLVEGDGLQAQANPSAINHASDNAKKSPKVIETKKTSIPIFDLQETMTSSDTEITSLGEFLASLSKETLVEQPMKTSTMDGDFITVIQSKEVQGILDRSKKAKSNAVSDDLVSETYASILRSQGKYDEAISVYQKLIIQNPKKKRFFAIQIEELQKT